MTEVLHIKDWFDSVKIGVKQFHPYEIGSAVETRMVHRIKDGVFFRIGDPVFINRDAGGYDFVIKSFNDDYIHVHLMSSRHPSLFSFKIEINNITKKK